MRTDPLSQLKDMLQSMNLGEVAEQSGVSVRTLYRLRDDADYRGTYATFERLDAWAREVSKLPTVPASLVRRGVGAPAAKRPRTPPKKPPV